MFKWPTVLRSVQIKENLTSNVSGNKNRVFSFFRKKCAKTLFFPMKIKNFKNSQNFFGNCFRDSYHIFLFKNKERISFTKHYNIFEILCHLLNVNKPRGSRITNMHPIFRIFLYPKRSICGDCSALSSVVIRHLVVSELY